jgi:predicted phage tail component-like protein
MADMDFIGFTYNGKHSWRDLGIYRTSDGSRYNSNLTATMTDKTADVPGGNGQYYFGTTFKNKTFTINYAFDNLTEEKFQQLKTTFDGKGIHDLIFDENPDIAWSAKVTGTASIKYLCFDDNALIDQYKRVYKGEGSLTFTCYDPFARSISWKGGVGNVKEQIGGTHPTPFELTIDFS